MGLDAAIDAHGDVLAAIADDLYAARRAFLREHFEGYVVDTYYYVPDDAYYCWPAHDEGAFEGFTDLLPAERDALDSLRDRGFERIGVGASRVAYRFPAATAPDLVVKLGRCGMGERFGMGRRSNLVESRVSAVADGAVLPSRYCEPRGRFAVYPYAEPVAAADVSEDDRAALAASLDERVPALAREEYTHHSNLCRWNGTLRTLDYGDFDGLDRPLGVPEHVDPESVIAGVDALRRRGEKPDIAAPGRLVSPRVAGE